MTKITLEYAAFYRSSLGLTNKCAGLRQGPADRSSVGKLCYIFRSKDESRMMTITFLKAKFWKTALVLSPLMNTG